MPLRLKSDRLAGEEYMSPAWYHLSLSKMSGKIL